MRHMQHEETYIQASRHDLEATRRGFETQLSAVEARTRLRNGGNAGISTDRVKPIKFDASTTWTLFYRQVEAATNHNDWTSREKARHRFAVTQAQAADILQCPSRRVTRRYRWRSEGRYGDHQLAVAYLSQLKARIQLSGETLQEFLAAFEQLVYL